MGKEPVTAEPEPPALAIEPPLPEGPIPAHERLGAEGVQRLRQRYREIVTRLAERVSDPARRDELREAADRLNPDAWSTPEEVAAGLEQYESVLASVQEIVGRKRRRRKKGGRTAESGQADLSGDAGQPGEDGALPAAGPDEDAGDSDPGDL